VQIESRRLLGLLAPLSTEQLLGSSPLTCELLEITRFSPQERKLLSTYKLLPGDYSPPESTSG
jgi:hypothetical protein